MKIETLLQILFANGHDNLVALAVKLDNNIDDTTPKPGAIAVEMTKSSLPAGMMFAKKSEGSWNYVMCPVIAHDKFKVKDNFLVQLPNGGTKWVSDTNRTEITTIIPIEEVSAVLAQ